MESELLPPWQSHRWAGHDYRSASSYFVTICTGIWRPIFGSVIETKMVFSNVGTIADEEWQRTCCLRTIVVPHVHCVMPNHVHLLFSINREGSPEEIDEGSTRGGLEADSIGSIVGGFKAAVSRRVRLATDFPAFDVWQRNYHDHVVRNERDFERITEYIVNNSAAWENDKFHPENPMSGR